jgi:stage IV sporulation protein FB
MSERLNWMLPSLEFPRLGALRIRVSLFFLLFAIVFIVRLGVVLGSVVVTTLLVSVLLHEMGHVVIARLTGGSATEVHLTPIGGLAMVQAGRGVWSQVVTSAAGPFVNLVLCLATFPSYYAPRALPGILNPIYLPVSQFDQEHVWRDLGLIVFALNWLLLLINLLPILPLDGGRIVRAVLTTRTHPELVDRVAMQVSLFASGVLMLAGLLGDWSVVVFLGAVLLLVNLVQLLEDNSSEREDDSFLGYDFSEGYTSLDRSAPDDSPAPRQPADTHRGLLDRWRERRRLQREHALKRRQEEAEKQLDDLLAKVHAHGMSSLTSGEQRLLRQVSELLRDRGKRPS